MKSHSRHECEEYAKCPQHRTDIHIKHFSSLVRMQETAEELCEEHGYRVLEQDSAYILLRRESDGYTRAFYHTPREW